MKPINILGKTCILLIFCCMSIFSIGQTADKKGIEQLQGEWEFANATIEDAEWPILFDLYNDYYRFYPEIEVKEDIVLLKDGDEVQKAKYEVNGNFLGVDLPSGESFIAEWIILEGKLYLEFDGFHPYYNSKEVKVLLTYSQK